MDRVHIASVEPLPGYLLRLGLSDGRVIERDFAAELAAPTGHMDAPLQDPAYFTQVRVDPELQTVVWPNGYDMDPDVLIADGPPAWARPRPSRDAEIEAAIAEIAAAKARLDARADGSKP